MEAVSPVDSIKYLLSSLSKKKIYSPELTVLCHFKLSGYSRQKHRWFLCFCPSFPFLFFFFFLFIFLSLSPLLFLLLPQFSSLIATAYIQTYFAYRSTFCAAGAFNSVLACVASVDSPSYIQLSNNWAEVGNFLACTSALCLAALPQAVASLVSEAKDDPHYTWSGVLRMSHS